MTANPRPLTTRAVGTVLRNAGFERSVRRPGRVRGLPEYSEGYKLDNAADSVVEVEWCPSSFRARNVTDEQARAKLDLYRTVLVDAGLRVDDGPSVVRYTLRVSRPEPA